MSIETAAPKTKESITGVDALVVCAQHGIELECLLECLLDVRQVKGQDDSFAGRVYYEGRFEAGGRSFRVVAIAQERMGRTDCAAVTTEGLRVFKPRMVAMVGVCAGRKTKGVRKCDIIVPSQVFTYDTGKYSEDSFEPEPRWCYVKHALLDIVNAERDRIIASIVGKSQGAAPMKLKPPGVHLGVMACGSAVIDRPGILDAVAETHRNVIALDMESYALLRAVELADPALPAVIVKGVMDHGAKKNDRDKRAAGFWSARFLKELIPLVLDLRPERIAVVS